MLWKTSSPETRLPLGKKDVDVVEIGLSELLGEQRFHIHSHLAYKGLK